MSYILTEILIAHIISGSLYIHNLHSGIIEQTHNVCVWHYADEVGWVWARTDCESDPGLTPLWECNKEGCWTP